MIKPDYYKGKDGKDLFDRFEDGLLTKEEVVGFYKGNIIKYVTRFEDKNGVEDLDKAMTYLSRLRKLTHEELDWGGLVAFNKALEELRQQTK